MPALEPDRTGSAKKRRCTRKQSEAEVASKRRKNAARRNTQTGNVSIQMNMLTNQCLKSYQYSDSIYF